MYRDKQVLKILLTRTTFEVVGKSEMEIAPDLIYIKVNINEKDTKNKVPVTELEKINGQRTRETWN